MELLADELELELLPAFSGGTNFAVAGATSGGQSVIDLQGQIGNYLLATGNQANANSLYIVFIGGNDIRNTAQLSNRDEYRVLFNAANQIKNSVEQLINAGANNIMVVNSSDIWAIPETQLRSVQFSDPQLARKLSFRSRVFNFFLKRLTNNLRNQSHAQIVPVDLFNFFNVLSKNAQDICFENSVDGCFIQIGLLPDETQQTFCKSGCQI